MCYSRVQAISSYWDETSNKTQIDEIGSESDPLISSLRVPDKLNGISSISNDATVTGFIKSREHCREKIRSSEGILRSDYNGGLLR